MCVREQLITAWSSIQGFKIKQKWQRFIFEFIQNVDSFHEIIGILITCFHEE